MSEMKYVHDVPKEIQRELTEEERIQAEWAAKFMEFISQEEEDILACLAKSGIRIERLSKLVTKEGYCKIALDDLKVKLFDSIVLYGNELTVNDILVLNYLEMMMNA